MLNQTNALEYAKTNLSNFKQELVDVLEIPSVSTDPIHKPDIRKTAEWLQNKLDSLGFHETKILETAGHPCVYAYFKYDDAAPTVLIYGHYDVQPTDPDDLWAIAPFTPTFQEDRLFARGASDMKGQIIASIAAVESLIKTNSVPVNIKFILEGEEEIGSPNLASALRKHVDLFKCDVILNPDAGMISPTSPTIVYGLRGLAYFEITVNGPARDLHSGMFGGAIHNPANVLSKLIAGMHDENGVIQLPGFYDSVLPLSPKEREELSRLPITEDTLKKHTGAKKLFGEKGYTPVEWVGARPTLDVNGFLSGFTGEGSKTVIPASAMAKISMRLVPAQDANEVYEQLKKYIEANIPDTVSYEIKQFAGGPAAITDRNHPGVIALAKALEDEWGTKPFYKREGGSIPVVTEMQEIIGAESVLSGFGLPGDNIHSPNESLHIPTWEKGINALINFFQYYAEGYEN